LSTKWGICPQFLGEAQQRVKRWNQVQNMKRPTQKQNTLHERRFTRKRSGCAIAAEALMNNAD